MEIHTRTVGEFSPPVSFQLVEQVEEVVLMRREI